MEKEGLDRLRQYEAKLDKEREYWGSENARTRADFLSCKIIASAYRTMLTELHNFFPELKK